jgi:CubicO group peptidase (beta-lactamase class C family)
MTTVEDRLTQLLAAARESDTTQLHLLHQGRELASIGGHGEPLSTASVTKLILGVTVGRAVRRELVALDDPVHYWFPEWSTGARAKITVRHVMGHISGLAADTWPRLDAAPPADMLAYVLDELPMAQEPGEVWAYNNAAVMLLPAIVTRAAGVPYLEFVYSELFRPLGIDNWTWRCDAAGNALGMATAAVNAASLAKVGQLLAQDGMWNGARLLNPDWVAECRRPPIRGLRSPGLLMLHRWTDDQRTGDPVAFGHEGTGGQQLWIYPASGLVIARLRDNRLPDGRGFEPGTPDQQFIDLPRVGARLDTALRATQGA